MKVSTTRRPGGRLAKVHVVLIVSLLGLLFSGMASAQWEVTDEQTHTKLDTTNKGIDETNKRLGFSDGKDINTRLKDLYVQQTFDPAQKSETYKDKPKDEIKDLPDFDLDIDKPQGTVSPIDKDKRCKDGDKICELIFDTERAKYNYSVAVYKITTEKRIKELKEIQEQRAALKEGDQGKLQSNTNRLLTLIAKMDIDKQQQKVALDAYDARIRYLQSARDTVADAANNGPRNMSATDVISGGAALVAAKIMFDSIPTVR